MTSREILDYYGAGDEECRLTSSLGRLERIRTWEILQRFLPPAPSGYWTSAAAPTCWP